LANIFENVDTFPLGLDGGIENTLRGREAIPGRGVWSPVKKRSENQLSEGSKKTIDTRGQMRGNRAFLQQYHNQSGYFLKKRKKF